MGHNSQGCLKSLETWWAGAIDQVLYLASSQHLGMDFRVTAIPVTKPIHFTAIQMSYLKGMLLAEVSASTVLEQHPPRQTSELALPQYSLALLKQPADLSHSCTLHLRWGTHRIHIKQSEKASSD